MDVLDKSLQPRKFKEYNLSRSLLQEPKCLGSSDAAEPSGPQFHNGLLMTSDGQKLVACGVEKVVWISLEDDAQQVMLLPAVTKPWPLSLALVDGLQLVAVRRGSQVHLCSTSFVYEVQLPDDLGDLLAATGSTSGREMWVSLLFVNKAHSAASPSYDLTLARVAPFDMVENHGGEPLHVTSSLHLFGSSAPLGTCLLFGDDGTEVLVLSHGKYDLERPSLAPDYEACEEQQKRQDADELDEDIGEMMRQQGLELPKSRGVSAILTLASSRSCQHYNLGLPAVTCRIYTLLPETARMAVVLRTQGHGAVCHCWVEPEARGNSKIKVRHHQTFPGLAVLCDTPSLAYLSFNNAWAAIGRWRSIEALQLFRHPLGKGTSVTQGLQLEGLRGLQVLGDRLFIWHSQGLFRYELQPEAVSPCPQANQTGEAEGDDWGEAPQADLPLENAW